METRAEVAVVSGFRTPFVRSGTALRDRSAVHLGQHVTTELLQRSGCDPHLVDEVVFGNIGQPPEATNIARVIALNAKVPKHVPAFTVNRNCASGLEAVVEAASDTTASSPRDPSPPRDETGVQRGKSAPSTPGNPFDDEAELEATAGEGSED